MFIIILGRLGKKEFNTTDPQAEVFVFDIIPIDKVLEVAAFEDKKLRIKLKKIPKG